MGQRQGRVWPHRRRRVRRRGAALGLAVRVEGACLGRGRQPLAHSGPAVFEMGLLERSDWKGAWISLGKDPAVTWSRRSGEDYDDLANGLAPSPYLRREFPLDKPVRRARLYATARGVYELYVNGTRVGDDVLAPGWTDYDRRIQYQTYDVTPLLAEGQNALGAVLGDGWFAGFVGFDPKHRGALYGPRPQLLAQLKSSTRTARREYRDRWLVEVLEGRSSLRPPHGRVVRRRREMPGLGRTRLRRLGVVRVGVEELGNTNLVAQPDEGVRVTEELKAKSVTEPESGRLRLRHGQEHGRVGAPRGRGRGGNE